MSFMINAYDIREFGASGDASTPCDDAFAAATAKLAAEGGGELFFPAGSYRFTRVGSAALHFDRVSNVTLRFQAGAEILMDNLQEDGMGGGHGVVFTGPAKNIVLDGVTVRWKTRPSGRGWGDSFRFEGYPDDAETISNVRFLNCRGENAPQTGAVFMGVSDVFVDNFEIVDTWADGLHFNGCRRVNVNGVRGVNVGDDTLAFVTYYSPQLSGEKGGTPFGFPALNQWSNAYSNASNITAVGGHANGIRVAGSLDVNISNVVVKDKWGGIQLDGAIATEDDAVGWSYEMSRNVNISNVVIDGCEWGLLVRTLNIQPDAPESFWSTDLYFSAFRIVDCARFGVDIQSCAGIGVSGLRTDSPVRLLNNRGRWRFDDWVVSDTDFVIRGVQGATVPGFAPNYEPLPEEYNALDMVRPGDISLSRMRFDSTDLEVVGVGSLRGRDVRFENGSAEFRYVRDLKILDWSDGATEDDLIITELAE